MDFFKVKLLIVFPSLCNRSLGIEECVLTHGPSRIGRFKANKSGSESMILIQFLINQFGKYEVEMKT